MNNEALLSNGEAQKNVLISQPMFMPGPQIAFLPVMWGILKTYWEHHGAGKDCINWLPPIYDMKDSSALLDRYQDTPVDVLGLSCYTWNWNLQCDFAERVKAQHPECLVVAGGPEPDYKDPDFFRKYPFIDMVVVQDGEITFTHILNKLLNPQNSQQLLAYDSVFSDIPGLYLPDTGGNGPVFTGPPDLPKEFPYSHYLEQSSYYSMIKLFCLD